MEPKDNKKPVILLFHHFHDDVKQLFERRGFHALLADHNRKENESIQVIVKEALLDTDQFHEKSKTGPISLNRQYVTWFLNIQIDAVLEWQRGRYDFPLLKFYQDFRHIVNVIQTNRNDKEQVSLPNFSKPPLFYLCLNWNGEPPENWETIGYNGLLSAPFDKQELKYRYDRVIQNLQQGITGPGLPERNISGDENQDHDDDPYKEIDEEIRHLFRISHQIELAEKRKKNDKRDEH